MLFRSKTTAVPYSETSAEKTKAVNVLTLLGAANGRPNWPAIGVSQGNGHISWSIWCKEHLSIVMSSEDNRQSGPMWFLDQ